MEETNAPRGMSAGLQRSRRLVGAALAVVIMGAATLATSGTAGAAVQAVAGQAEHIAPPPSVELNALESDTVARVFNERQCVKLASNLGVDITLPGTYDKDGPFSPGTIPAGTTVSSHLIHTDKVGSEPTPVITYNGSVTVDQDIIGVIVVTSSLDASDVVGASGTAYPTGTFRGFDPNNPNQNDGLTLDVALRTVNFHLETQPHPDQIRIVTRCQPAGGQGCTPGYWKQRHHFDSWVGYAPSQKFETVFAVNAFSGNPSLVQVLGKGGGGVNALGRHAVAALLNASNPKVSFALTPSSVITMTRNAILSGNKAKIEATKNALEDENEQGCPLN